MAALSMMRASPGLLFDERPTFGPWTLPHKYDLHGAKLADGHYSQRKVGSPQFMPPGETVVLVASAASSVGGVRTLAQDYER